MDNPHSLTGIDADLPEAVQTQRAYTELVSRRKACCRCEGLINPSCLDKGVFDSDQIGPWTRWQGNLGAKCMVVGQDWGDENYFRANRGREAPNNPTNTTLRILLAVAGINIDSPSAEKSQQGAVFLTNAILCLKRGGMQAPVHSTWFNNCGTQFLRPTIDLVSPRVVITLGERAYRAACRAYSLRPQSFRAAVEREQPRQLSSATLLVPVYHCGARILNTHRPLAKQKEDWARVGELLAMSAQGMERHSLGASFGLGEERRRGF